MSIADKIQRLETAKDNIADAITAKGGTVNEGDGFEEFSSDIGTISSGITVNESYDISEGTLTKGNVTLGGDITAHIPDGVVTVGNKSFMDDTTITKVIMPDSVTAIEDGIFQYPSSSSNAMAFGDCVNLKEVVFSNNLTSIGNYAFYGCTGLTDIYYTGTQTQWEAIEGLADAGIPEGATIHYEYTPE